jgi:hypothetical protein
MFARYTLSIPIALFLLTISQSAWSQTGTLKGVITDSDGAGIENIGVKVGNLETQTDHLGNYEILNVPAGSVTIEVTDDWFEDKSEPAEVTADTETVVDITVDAIPLQTLPEDRDIEKAYNDTFDWTTDKLSIAFVAPPTRANVDKGIYSRNPALYKDTSGESPVTVSAWDFPMPSGAPNEGQQAFEEGSIKNSIRDTALSKAERASSFVWEPAVQGFLTDWDIEKSLGLYHVTYAVEAQNWGGSSIFPPQTIQHVYLHEGEIWVEIVFENWVSFDMEATDSDGDGYDEIYAKVDGSLYTSEVYDKLANEYLGTVFSALELRNYVTSDLIDDLYSTTNPEIISTIGVPYDVPGHGAIQYPYVVLRHSDNSVNILLVDLEAPKGGGGGGCSVIPRPNFPVTVLALILLPFLAAFLLRRKHL